MYVDIAMMIFFVSISAAVGFTYSKITKTNDSKVEEVAEEIVERQGEALLHLEPGELHGKIDLSANSPEK